MPCGEGQPRLSGTDPLTHCLRLSLLSKAQRSWPRKHIPSPFYSAWDLAYEADGPEWGAPGRAGNSSVPQGRALGVLRVGGHATEQTQDPPETRWTGSYKHGQKRGSPPRAHGWAGGAQARCRHVHGCM